MLRINFVEYVHISPVCSVPYVTHEHNVQQAEAQITALSQQLEEVFQIRETEAEELLKRQEAQYEAQLSGAFCVVVIFITSNFASTSSRIAYQQTDLRAISEGTAYTYRQDLGPQSYNARGRRRRAANKGEGNNLVETGGRGEGKPSCPEGPQNR